MLAGGVVCPRCQISAVIKYQHRQQLRLFPAYNALTQLYPELSKYSVEVNKKLFCTENTTQCLCFVAVLKSEDLREKEGR